MGADPGGESAKLSSWDFACPDWFERIKAGTPPIADLPLNPKWAQLALRRFDNLRLPDVAGHPRLGDVAGDWMRAVVAAAWGSLDRTARSRAVREVFILIPKKNGKTTFGAALGLTYMLITQRRNADLLIVAPTQKISDRAFRQARGMIMADPEGYLQKRFHIQDHQKTIRDAANENRLMIRTFGADVLTGAAPVFCLIDEVHELGGKADGEAVMEQIRGGVLPYPDSLLVQITTQSSAPPQGIFKAELDYARAVRDGRVRDHVRMLPMLYELPEAMQRDEAQPWRDPKSWGLVTPGLGRVFGLGELEAGFARAVHDGDQALIGWATQHLNVEVGMALHQNRWPGADFWAGAARPGLTLEALMASSEVCTVGIDQGGADDLAALAVIGRHRSTRAWQIWVRAWCQPEALERRPQMAARLRDFERQGDLVIAAKRGDVVTQMSDIVQRLDRAGLLPDDSAVGVDAWGIGATQEEFALRGLRDEQVIRVSQGWKLQGAIHALECKLADGSAVHGGQPILGWAVGNAKVTQVKSAIYVSKDAASDKIDPLVACFNAAMVMGQNPGRPKVNLDDFLSRPVMVV